MTARKNLHLFICTSVFLIFYLPLSAFAADDADPALTQADHAFAQAASSSNKKALNSILDKDFAWVDSAGKVFDRSQVLSGIPSSPANSDSTETKQRLYGDVGLILAVSGRTHAARFWVKHKGKWRLLVYHEATLSEEARSGAPRPKDCENPCKTLPYTPQNDAEKGIITSWQELETAVTNHDSATWGQHIADEFIIINSNNDHPFSKADRMSILDKQKQTGTPSAPIPLVSARMFDFGDTVIMTAKHQRGDDKPVHVSRIWIKRDGHWLMAFSEQTIAQ